MAKSICGLLCSGYLRGATAINFKHLLWHHLEGCHAFIRLFFATVVRLPIQHHWCQ